MVSLVRIRVKGIRSTLSMQMYSIVPDIEVGYCLGPEENGVSYGEGGEGGPAPPEAEEISSKCSARAGNGQHGQGRGGSEV
jgi:hypothetical protein